MSADPPDDRVEPADLNQPPRLQKVLAAGRRRQPARVRER